MLTACCTAAKQCPHASCSLTWQPCGHHYCTALYRDVPQPPAPAPCRFVFCRQRQDERLRRGGEQKSLVILSELPFSSVLGMLAQYAGPLYFNRGPVALQEASVQIQGMLCLLAPWLGRPQPVAPS